MAPSFLRSCASKWISGAAVAAGATTTAAAAPAKGPGVDGTWKPTDASQVDYRVKQVLFGQSTTAVGRTNKVTGQMVISGTSLQSESFTVDMTSVCSSSWRCSREAERCSTRMDNAVAAAPVAARYGDHRCRQGADRTGVIVTERVHYDEFAYFQDNAAEFRIAWTGAPTVRRESITLVDGRRMSALVWGTGAPEVVFLHGGAQNAHTWDTVALALNRPVVCIDLPGHGLSDDLAPHVAPGVSPVDNAIDLAPVIAALAPAAHAVVGMSLGGLTTIALAHRSPELVRSAVLVDVTPGVTGQKSKAISDFVTGPATFPSFSEILERTIAHNPGRTEASLRRGILHNAEQQADGSWRWRYRRADRPGALGNPGADSGPVKVDFATLWPELATIEVPVMLLRGMRSQSVVDDADEVELLRLQPAARVERITKAGHSVQGDTPVLMAHLLEDFLP